MSNAPLTPAILVPYGEDVVAVAARHIVDHCTEKLPLLDQVVVLVPDLQQSARLRRRLTAEAETRGCRALLGPRIETIAGYLSTLGLPTAPILADEARELVLMEALRQHADLFGEADLWRLSRSLLELFDELNLQQRGLPRTLREFEQILNQAYGVHGAAPAHLSREAEIVHTLWHAWHAQLEAEQATDQHRWYLAALAGSLPRIEPEARFFAVGFSALRPAERSWMQTLHGRGQLTFVFHGSASTDGYHPDAPLHDLLRQLTLDTEARGSSDAKSTVIDAVFDLAQGNLRQRAEAVRAAHGASPLTGAIRVFAAADSEQEARAVELQVRQWLLQGKRNIGIVTEDRRLARRVRALLERAGISLADSVGWALSTTSSATVIERWLQAVEEDFSHQPMMDLLKSPFLLPTGAEAVERYTRAVYRLEQDIILHENIPRGLDRFRRHLRYRQRRLGWPPGVGTTVDELLQRLADAARPLLELKTGSQPLDRFMDALLESLTLLGLQQPLNDDAAGARIVQQLEQLRQAARQRPLTCDWFAFRTWLGAALERSHFRPPIPGSGVRLLNLEQSTLARFDCLLLAAAEREFLPGSPGLSPYFNDHVRRELGLSGWHQQLLLRLHHFRRLLEAAPELLLTRRLEQDGEELLPSPWLEALQALHEQAYGDDLRDTWLAQALRDPSTQVQSPDEAPLPLPSGNPRAVLPASRVPDTVSAAAQQHLLDCPYQFFAADCLRLKPVEEIREALEKSDYGERVHRCLEAFHGGVADLPGPFEEELDHSRRASAIALLETISQAVFAQDLEDNFIHRGWLKRWLVLIPQYIDWQIERQRNWRPSAVESSLERQLSGPWRLKGRLDRIDCDREQRFAVIDYKTGAIPKPADVLSGEAVQLISYALLRDDVARVEYLQLDKQVKSVSPLEGEELSNLRAATGDRLVAVLEAVAAGSPLPAWGDLETCSRCDMTGLCRRQTWEGPVR